MGRYSTPSGGVRAARRALGVLDWCLVRPLLTISRRRPDVGGPELFNFERSPRPVDPPVVMHHRIALVVVPDPHTATHDRLFITRVPIRRCVPSRRGGQAPALREERMEGVNKSVGLRGELFVDAPLNDR